MNETFSAALLRWYDGNRRELPWRGETDPYRIWLSEIMLQQTRTETVERYYRAFTEKYPTVFALAQAEEDEVLKLWEGMGYYSRARNLHKAARLVAGELQGIFPSNADNLRRLPGVGPYASCAIASIAYGEPVPALDGNQARVISRVQAVDRVVRTPAELWDEATALLDRERPGDYNQALMDLGASVCLPRRPRCDVCPVRGFCRAMADGNAEDYPRLPPPILKKEEARTVLLVRVNGRILVCRRPEKGLLGGLWEFPNLPGTLAPAEAAARLTETGVEKPRLLRKLPEAKHVFTHLVWNMTGLALVAETAGEWRAVDAGELDALGMPSALRKYREIAGELLAEEEG